MAPVSLSGSSVASASALAPYARLSAQLSDSTYRISSGNRFTAGQGSPDLSIAQRLQLQVTTYRQGQQNGAASSSLLDSAASGLDEISALLATLSGLATQASDNNITNGQRAYLQAAFVASYGQIDSIASTTSFGGAHLLDGSASGEDGGAAIPLVLGNPPEGNINADIRSVTTDRLFGGSTPDLASAANAAAAVTAVATADSLLQPVVSKVAGYQERVFFAAQNLDTTIAGIDSARRALTDTDFNAESQRLTGLTNQKKTALAVLAQARNLSPGLLNLLQVQNLRPSLH